MSSYANRPSWGTHIEPKTIGRIGVLTGGVAAIIAVPPVELRTILWPIFVGLIAVALGIFTLSRGVKRMGWLAIGSGLIGMTLGVLATRSSGDHLNTVFTPELIAQMFAFSTPLVFAGIGGMFSERSGVVNIGLEGEMLMGAFFGIYAADRLGTWWWGVLLGAVAGGLLALVHAFFTISLRADQIVVGTAINFLALGITGYWFFQAYNGEQVPLGVDTIPNVHLPGSGHWHFLHAAFGNLSVLVWLSFLVVFISWVVVFKTPLGLRIRACGEHPRAADTVGINVYAVRYGCVILSGMLAATGGTFLSLASTSGTFQNNMTVGKGFIALAALIFGNWKPLGTFCAALLFGFSQALSFQLDTYSTSAGTLFKALPYVLTLIAVAGIIGRTIPPAADGKPYVRQ